MKMIWQLPLDQALASRELDEVKKQRDVYESQIKQILAIPFRKPRQNSSKTELAYIEKFNECLEIVRIILLPRDEVI